MAAYGISRDQNSLDRKLSSSSSTENVFPGRSGPLTTQRSVADSLQSYSESDFVAGGGTRGNYYAGRKGSSVSAQEKSESATHFGAVPPPHRSSSCPDSNYEQRQGKTKKGRSHARSGSKQALELSVINESIGTPNKRDSYVDISDETPLFWGSIDKKKKKKKGTKGTKKESAVVGAAAAGGTAAVGVAAHSAGLMASSAAGSCCCVGVVAKSVSVAMFVGVVVTVGYAGYNGVITALHQSVMTTVASTVGLEMTTFDPMTTAYTTFGCPLPVKPTLESLLNDIIDDGRCNSSAQGFHSSQSSCKEFFLCSNDMRLMGVGECPCDEYFSPNSLSCEFQNGGYYRDAFDCNLYHRCDDTVGIVRTDGACNTMEYFNVRIPVAPTCARKENVPDCPSNAISTTAVPETTIIT